jgi:tRNA/rRNA methyltransferase
MAGTDRSQAAVTGGPAVILVAPQLGENIGMVARAMLNCGLGELRLVRPRDGWPNPAAESAASGALEVITNAGLFETTAAAVADLNRVYVTTARPRGMIKPVVTPRRAAAELRAALAAGERAGLLFGPERTGLTNDDMCLGEVIVEVPLNPAFKSLNLAQAVLLLAYEWYQAGAEEPQRRLELGDSRPAPRQQLIGFFERLETTLDEVGFFHPPEKRPTMVRTLRNLFLRAELSEQELRSLHGIVSALLGAKLKRAPGGRQAVAAARKAKAE